MTVMFARRPVTATTSELDQKPVTAEEEIGLSKAQHSLPRRSVKVLVCDAFERIISVLHT